MGQKIVLVMNSGSLESHTFDNPSAVTDGVIAFFNAKTGAVLTVDGGGESDVPSEFQVVRGGDPLLATAILKKENIVDVIKNAYNAPEKQITTLTSPPTGTAGEHILRVEDVSLGNFPVRKFSSHFIAIAGSTAAQILNGLALGLGSQANVARLFDVNTNKQVKIALSGSSGTANVTIGSTDYLATFSSDLDTTADNFVTAHAANILANHGLVVTALTAGAENALIFENTPNTPNATYDFADPSIANATGDLAGTVSTPSEITNITITGKNVGEAFEVTLDGLLYGATLTATQAPSKGSGTYEEILQMELDNVGVMFGEYYAASPLLGQREAEPTFAQVAGQYDTYHILHKNNVDESINGVGFRYTEIVIAVESSATGDLDNFFDEYDGV